MISGKRVIAAMLTALMAVTFTANTAVSVYATGVTATENAQTIDAQSTDAQALTPEEQKAQELQQVYDMPVESNGYKDWPQGPGTYGEAGIVMEVGTGAILYAKNIDAHEYPASITKVLTALVALENGQTDGQCDVQPRQRSVFTERRFFRRIKRGKCNHTESGNACDASGICQ